jgi:hypothetical protein
MGSNKWTSIEEIAIKDRILDQGPRSLFFVMLDQRDTPPTWLPETTIRLNYAQFGDSLVGAIKLRVVELGSELIAETALDRAKRAESAATTRQERENQLARNAAKAIPEEWRTLCHQLQEKLSAIRPVLPSAQLDHFSHNEEFLIRTSLVSSLLHLSFSFPASGSFILVRLNIGRMIPLGGGHGRMMHVPGEEPDCVSKVKYSIDYNEVLSWCWCSEIPRDPLLDAASLSERLIKETIALHEDVETGKIIRRRKTRGRPPSVWG